MKASLHFNLPEDNEAFETAVAANHLKAAIWDISQRVFRPARKHGYPGTKMSKFLNADGELKEEIAEAIGELEELFYDVLDDHNLNLD